MTDRHGPCICNFSPVAMDGPDEFCPLHGRTYSELCDILIRQSEEIGRLQYELHLAKAESLEPHLGLVKGLDG